MEEIAYDKAVLRRLGENVALTTGLILRKLRIRRIKEIVVRRALLKKNGWRKDIEIIIIIETATAMVELGLTKINLFCKNNK